MKRSLGAVLAAIFILTLSAGALQASGRIGEARPGSGPTLACSDPTGPRLSP